MVNNINWDQEHMSALRKNNKIQKEFVGNCFLVSNKSVVEQLEHLSNIEELPMEKSLFREEQII